MTHIWVPKMQILEPDRELVVTTGVAARYRLRSYRPDGRQHRDSGWFKNLITDAGLDQLGVPSNHTASAFSGTGNAPPAPGDTALQSQFASTSSVAFHSTSQLAGSPYTLTKTITFRFAAPGGAGVNITEVGVGPAGTALFSRALVVDGGGNPAVFPVAQDEQYDVTYQVSLFPPLADAEAEITIDSDTYQTITRAASIATWGLFGEPGGGAINPAQAFMSFVAVPGVSGHTAYSGNIGAITGLPAGTSSSAASRTLQSYTPGTFFRDHIINFGLGNGNVGGIRSISTTFGAQGEQDTQHAVFQTQYDPVIPKDGTKVLSLPFRVSWTRA